MLLQQLTETLSGVYTPSKHIAAHDGRGLIRRENVQIISTSPRYWLRTAYVTAYEDNNGNLWAVTEHIHDCLKKQ